MSEAIEFRLPAGVFHIIPMRPMNVTGAMRKTTWRFLSRNLSVCAMRMTRATKICASVALPVLFLRCCCVAYQTLLVVLW